MSQVTGLKDFQAAFQRLPPSTEEFQAGTSTEVAGISRLSAEGRSEPIN